MTRTLGLRGPANKSSTTQPWLVPPRGPAGPFIPFTHSRHANVHPHAERNRKVFLSHAQLPWRQKRPPGNLCLTGMRGVWQRRRRTPDTTPHKSNQRPNGSVLNESKTPEAGQTGYREVCGDDELRTHNPNSKPAGPDGTRCHNVGGREEPGPRAAPSAMWDLESSRV